RPPRPTLFPYTTLFRSAVPRDEHLHEVLAEVLVEALVPRGVGGPVEDARTATRPPPLGPGLDEARLDEPVEVLAHRVVVQTHGPRNDVEGDLALFLEHVQDRDAAR